MIEINQSIFGSDGPKFVYDLGGSGETTVIINYWVQDQDEPETVKEIIHESELEADRDIIPLGYYWVFAGHINLLKYDNLTLARSKFNEINKFNHKKVTLWKHRENQSFKDADGNDVLFYLDVIPKNITTLDFRDVIYLKFRSLTEVNFSDSSSIVIQPDEIIIEGGASI